MILKGLPLAYKTFCTVTTQKDKDCTFAEFKVALRSFEETEAQNCSRDRDDTVMMNDAKSIQCYTCYKYGHKSFQCKMRKEKNLAEKYIRKKWCEVCKCTSHNKQQGRKKKNNAKTVTAKQDRWAP